MSYDVWAIYGEGDDARWEEPFFSDSLPGLTDSGGGATVAVTEQGYARCGNYTSNVSGMWWRCLTRALETVPEAIKYAGNDDRYMLKNYGETVQHVDGTKRARTIDTETICLRDLHGQPCADLVPLLTAAVAWGVEHIDELRELNPSNGWGNAEGAVTFLWDLQRLCEENPEATLRVSS